MKPIRDRFPRPSEHFWHRILPASTIIMVSLVFLFAIVAWSEPLPGAGSSGSNSPQMMLAASTNLQTPLPTHPPVLSPTSTSNISEELLANPNQTDGLVLGGIQALSRSTYAKLLEDRKEDPTSFFSFLDVLSKIAIVSGTFIFGLVNSITGNMRYSVLTLALFFIIGFFILTTVATSRINTSNIKS